MKIILVHVLVLVINFASSANIFCAAPTHSKSHVIVVHALLHGLAEKGHNITLLTPFPMDNLLPNYRQITISLEESSSPILSGNPSNPFLFFLKVPSFAARIQNMMNAMMEMPELQKIINDEKFDLVIAQTGLSDVLFGFGAIFNCPTIAYTSLESIYSIDQITANPYALSYVSHSFPGYPEPMIFKHRVLNMIWLFIDKFYFTDYLYYRNKMLYNKHFSSQKYRSYEESIKNISLFLTAGHFSQGQIRPLVPSIIQIGGIQIKDKPSPLPEDLQQWMDESIEGVIYFSMGTNIHSSSLSPELIKQLLTVFRQLKLKVLWKFENEISSSDNIRIEKWVPQNDILQHKNMKIFISHGGWGSVTEAKFYGVPMILFPIFGDQIKNSNNVVKQGWGIKLSLLELNTQLLLEAINEILTDQKYKNHAKYESLLYRDRPNTALEEGIFWVEYVMRHRGAKHLQSHAVDLNFFEYHSLDVIGFLSLVFLVLIFVLYKFVRFATTVSFGRKLKML